MTDKNSLTGSGRKIVARERLSAGGRGVVSQIRNVGLFGKTVSVFHLIVIIFVDDELRRGRMPIPKEVGSRCHSEDRLVDPCSLSQLWLPSRNGDALKGPGIRPSHLHYSLPFAMAPYWLIITPWHAQVPAGKS